MLREAAGVAILTCLALASGRPARAGDNVKTISVSIGNGTTDSTTAGYLASISSNSKPLNAPTQDGTISNGGDVLVPAGSTIQVVSFNGNANSIYTGFDISYTPPGAVDPFYATVQRTTGDVVAVAGNGQADVVGAEYFATTNQSVIAFLWTPQNGLQELGTPDFTGTKGSSATAVNADGTVVVGQIGGAPLGPPSGHAFRWTQALGIVDIGTLSGPTGASGATGVSADGTIVVGTSSVTIVQPTDPSQPGIPDHQDAFRWILTNAATGAGAMDDLGGLVSNGGSSATAISADGTTIVGYAPTANATHAVLWNAAQTGPQDLGTVSGLANAKALAVSGNGAIVVGTSFNNDSLQGGNIDYNPPEGVGFAIPSSSVAFRWTAATGMQDLSKLLTTAGVNLGGMQLLAATSITANGEFIGGVEVPAGSPSNTPTQPFIARYLDAAVVLSPTPTPTPSPTPTPTPTPTPSPTPSPTPTPTPSPTPTPTPTPAPTPTPTPTPPIGGLTTASSVQTSVDQLSHERTRLIVQSRGFDAPITDDMDPLWAPSQVHGFVEAGSESLGARGRETFDSGLMLLGGVAWGDQEYHDVQANDGVTATAAIRYAPGLFETLRPFVEVGGLIGRTETMIFSRDYANGEGVANGRGSAGANTSAIYGRIGGIWMPSQADQVGAYLEYGHQSQSIGGYVETLSQTNPFEAHVGGGGDYMDVGKIGLRYTHTEPVGWEYGAGLTVSRAFKDVQVLPVAIPGFGFVPADRFGQLDWLEYGAHLGYSFTPRSTLTLFVTGLAGLDGVGGSGHFGVDYRMTF